VAEYKPSLQTGWQSDPPPASVASLLRRACLRAIILLLLLSGPSFAASVTSHYTCVQGHEQEATAKLQAFGTQALTNFFRYKSIEINQSALQFSVTVTTQADIDGAPYVAFAGSAGGGSGPIGSSIGSAVTAKDGTQFNVLFSSGSDQQNMAEYRAVGTQTGFDREGNPMNRHCRLRLFNSGDGNASKNLLVLNAGSGHVLGLIPLPAEISLY
jgi:hypothetical protein